MDAYVVREYMMRTNVSIGVGYGKPMAADKLFNQSFLSPSSIKWGTIIVSMSYVYCVH